MAVIDLTGGLEAGLDHGLRDHPKIDFMREGVSVWVFDDDGRFGLPRVALEAVGPDWDRRLLQVNVDFADGTVLTHSAAHPAGPAEDAAGQLTVFSGGPLELRCQEPFARWTVTFDGEAVHTSAQAQIDETVDPQRTAHLEFEIDAQMALPPWITGTMSQEADATLAASDAVFVGGRRSASDGMRYEQLFRAQGTLRHGGSEWSFNGSGLRIHRQGLRNLEGFTGHVWQSALFPDGRGFGYMWLLPNNYKEGFLFSDGRMVPARIVQAPFMNRMVPAGEDVSIVFESELGRTTIEAETAYSNFIPAGQPFFTEGSYPLFWQQAGVRYRWDGVETYGMMERSSRPEVMGR